MKNRIVSRKFIPKMINCKPLSQIPKLILKMISNSSSNSKFSNKIKVYLQDLEVYLGE